MIWQPAPDIQKRFVFLIQSLGLSKIDPTQLHFFRSYGSSGRAIARIWGLPTIWQQALNLPPGYCLEVISEKFDHRSLADQEKILIHELLHIPKNFTGGLVPHRNSKRRTFRHYEHDVDKIYNSLPVKSFES